MPACVCLISCGNLCMPDFCICFCLYMFLIMVLFLCLYGPCQAMTAQRHYSTMADQDSSSSHASRAGSAMQVRTIDCAMTSYAVDLIRCMDFFFSLFLCFCEFFFFFLWSCFASCNCFWSLVALILIGAFLLCFLHLYVLHLTYFAPCCCNYYCLSHICFCVP